MGSVIAAAVVLFVLQTLIAPSLRYLGGGAGRSARIRSALGPRDAGPPPTVMSERASRALVNLHEAVPVFLAVALWLEIHEQGQAGAPWGWVFVAARLIYVPAYLSGVPGVRSVVWGVSWVGLAGMVWIATE